MPDFDGLNLTWETLEGIAKHNGPLLPSPDAPPRRACRWRSPTIRPGTTSSCTPHASAEAQVAALSDDIAYVNHDLHDGLQAGLFELDEILRAAAGRRLLRRRRPPVAGSRRRRGGGTRGCAASSA